MDLTLTPRQQDVVAGVREWLLHEEIPATSGDLDTQFAAARAWQQRLYDAGWLGLGWPIEYGGKGGDRLEQILVNSELARAHAPLPAGLIGLEIVGPVILEHGTEEQRQRYLPSLLDGREIWSQGFSEPDAGSDLASLQTSGKVVGDTILVNGQKVWTSWAQFSRWCAVLVRTDQEETPHKGISYLLVDVESTGVTIRPLVQMTGDAEFNEVFFDDVEVPIENVLGGLGAGWQLAMATLSHERGPFAIRRHVELRVALDQLALDVQRAHRSGTRLIDDTEIRRRFGRCEVMVEALAAQTLRIVDRLENGGPDAESSVDKLLLADTEQQLFGLALDTLGDDRMIAEATADGVDAARWISGYLYGRSASIYGGTAEIQRGIIAKRLLGIETT